MKNNFLRPFIGTVILLLIISCKVEPQTIDYGNDQCSFCVMNIVDKAHSAQYVTKKGKQFKFDAIECMVSDLKDKNEEELSFLLVADFKSPGSMIPATTANYIISEEIKSPMGANLSAVSSSEIAMDLVQNHSGNLYNWTLLKSKLSEQ